MKKSIIFVTNIDETLIGKTICGYTLQKVYRGSTRPEHQLPNGWMTWEFADNLFSGNDTESAIVSLPNNKFFYQDRFLQSDDKGSYYLYFSKTSEDKDLFLEGRDFIKCMVLAKVSAVSFSMPYDFEDGIGTVIIKSPKHNYKSIDEWPIFAMMDTDILAIEKLYADYSKICVNKKEIDRMIEIWIDSRRIVSSEAKFIMHVCILEMFIDGNSELSHRLSRSIAVFLGKTEADAVDIFNSMKSLYNLRSKFLHEGKDITEDKDFELESKAQEYARKLIVELIQVSKNSDNSLSTIRDKTNKSGFGCLNLGK